MADVGAEIETPDMTLSERGKAASKLGLGFGGLGGGTPLVDAGPRALAAEDDGPRVAAPEPPPPKTWVRPFLAVCPGTEPPEARPTVAECLLRKGDAEELGPGER